MKRYLRVLAITLLLVVTATGCGVLNSTRQQDAELKSLLPGQKGFEWRYFGFVEYDHYMKLNAIESQGRGTRYLIAGEVGDPSGGESGRNFNLQLVYTIEKGVWVQEKQAEMMMDSEFDRIEILRAPLQKGATWAQQVIDRHGQQRTLDCTIEDIRSEQGVRTLVVVYRERNSVYYEKREIREGTGITMFERLWISPEGNFEIGYSLWEAVR